MWSRSSPLLLTALLCAAVLCSAAERQGSAPKEAPKEDKVIPFDPDDYPESTLHATLQDFPCRKERPEVKDVIFSAVLGWQGAVRELPGDRTPLMKDWTRHIGDPEAHVRYKEEVSLSEGGKVWWMPAPEGLLPYMKMELQPGDRLKVYVVYAGCASRGPVFVIEDYDELDQTEEESGDILIRLPTRPPRIS